VGCINSVLAVMPPTRIRGSVRRVGLGVELWRRVGGGADSPVRVGAVAGRALGAGARGCSARRTRGGRARAGVCPRLAASRGTPRVACGRTVRRARSLAPQTGGKAAGFGPDLDLVASGGALVQISGRKNQPGKRLICNRFSKWRGPESNRRHHDFQGGGTGSSHRQKVLQIVGFNVVSEVLDYPRIRADIGGFGPKRRLEVQKRSAAVKATRAGPRHRRAGPKARPTVERGLDQYPHPRDGSVNQRGIRFPRGGG
jgi:hypothetical protein